MTGPKGAVFPKIRVQHVSCLCMSSCSIMTNKMFNFDGHVKHDAHGSSQGKQATAYSFLFPTQATPLLGPRRGVGFCLDLLDPLTHSDTNKSRGSRIRVSQELLLRLLGRDVCLNQTSLGEIEISRILIESWLMHLASPSSFMSAHSWRTIPT